VLGVVGQFGIKAGLNRVGPLNLEADGPVAAIWRIVAQPLIWGGLGLYGVSTLFWLTALSQVELGYAYPFISLTYVLILVGSWFFFREKVSSWRVIGVTAICLGVLIVARG
jgi:drug/metabolite transporter (DMT)-like permease